MEFLKCSLKIKLKKSKRVGEKYGMGPAYLLFDANLVMFTFVSSNITMIDVGH